LASASPRRKELLEGLGLQFKVMSVDVDESIDAKLSLEEMVKTLANRKAQALIEQTNTHDCVIAADTLVVKDGIIFGKPSDEEQAIEFLSALSATVHQVTTGVCIQYGNRRKLFAETTDVWFNEIPDSSIEYYIKNYKVLDKAGAYAIQEWIGLALIQKIEGCFFNVVGLPVSQVYRELKELGVVEI